MPNFPIRYRTIVGAIVTVDRDGRSYTARCEPCDEDHTGALNTTRTWANTHASTCRAIPNAEAAP